MKNFIAWMLCIWLGTSFAQDVPISSDHKSPKPSKSTKSNFNYRYTATFDKNMSSTSSADLAMSGIEAYSQFDDYCFDGANIFGKASSYITRLMSTSYIIVANHEISGHGARIREFGLRSSYEVSVFTDLHV